MTTTPAVSDGGDFDVLKSAGYNRKERRHSVLMASLKPGQGIVLDVATRTKDRTKRRPMTTRARNRADRRARRSGGHPWE